MIPSHALRLIEARLVYTVRQIMLATRDIFDLPLWFCDEIFEQLSDAYPITREESDRLLQEARVKVIMAA